MVPSPATARPSVQIQTFEMDDLHVSRGTEGVLMLRLSKASVIRVMAQTLESPTRV